ncbi:MAG: transcription antitermination factor NusB, partial [Eubacteriales bacterium]
MSRRLARETALQILFQMDFIGERDKIDESLDHWAAEFSVSKKSLEFARELICGTLENIDIIDKKISGLSRDWAVARMSVVDRNLMRMSAYEILYKPDTPKNVIINEAVEIAKIYG